MIKIFILSLIAVIAFAKHPYIYSADFEWRKDGNVTKNNSVINDKNMSFSWKIWFNDEFMKAYDGKKPRLTEVYEAEYPCWDKNILDYGKLSEDNRTYKYTTNFDITRNKDFPNQKAFAYSNTWDSRVEYPSYNDNDCNAYYTHTSHDKILVYINDTLLHTFEFSLIPPEDISTKKVYEQREYKPYIPPNYAKMYPNTPQIILPKVHIYDVKNFHTLEIKKILFS